MTIRLGILGADDTMEIILSVAGAYPEINCQPIVYKDEEETIDKLKQCANEVDMWLFSGQVPYFLARNSGGIDKPMFYIPYTGSSLYRTLLQIAFDRKWMLDRLSYDTFKPLDIERTFQEAKIKIKPVFVKHYPGIISSRELSDYHYNLWHTGQTLGAVTCLRSAYRDLQSRGVPVFRVLPTAASVESVLNLILRTNETIHFRDTQIAVQMLEIDSFAGLTKERFSTDEIHLVEIKITEKFLAYAKRVQGSLKAAGPGRYVIFTTRGLLQNVTGNFTFVPDIDDSLKTAPDTLTCGIGIGKTAYEAEIKAGKALLHAKEHGKGSWMVFFDDNTITGPLGKPEQIAYSCSSEKLQLLSQQTTLSVSTLSKLDAVIKKIDRKEINAFELAQYLNILPRSARRILKELESRGFAHVVGEESPHPRGRPRKVYHINF